MRSDLVGKRFGLLTVTDGRGKNAGGHYLWLCRCDCGGTRVSTTAALQSGGNTSCGCALSERRIKDIKGKRFGMLVALGRAGATRHGLKWRCKCDCGKEIITYGSFLRRGASASCGCTRATRDSPCALNST